MAAEHATGIRWGRIVAGAFFLEIALIVLFVPLLAWWEMASLVPFVPFGCLGLGFAAGWWVVRKVRSRPILHGVLVGILATVIYLLLCLANPDGIAAIVAAYGPFLFVLSNVMKIVGAAAGSFARGRQGST